MSAGVFDEQITAWLLDGDPVIRYQTQRDLMNIIQKKRTKDGVWKIPGQHPGKVHFVIEESGKNSRWNTLRALRILKWWYY